MDSGVPQTELDAQLLDCDHQVSSGCHSDVAENLRCQLARPANWFDTAEDPSPSEGCAHPPVHRRGTQGMDPMKPVQFPDDLTMMLALSGKQAHLRSLHLLGVVHGPFAPRSVSWLRKQSLKVLA